MKILFFFPKINNYSNFKPLINIATFLTSKEHQVFIATTSQISEEQARNFPNSVIFIQKELNYSKLKWIDKLLRNDFDCFVGVQAHNAYWLILGKIVYFRFKKKVISWEHSSPLSSLKNEYKKTWPIHLIIRKFFSIFTNAFFCVSNGAVDEMRKILGSSSKKAMYTPNFIYNSKDLDILLKKTSNIKKITFISVGRLSKEKGLLLSLCALSKLENIDYEYLIVGNGPCYHELVKYVEKNPNLNNKIKFLGRRTDVLSLMMSSDVLLLPSYFEGLPTVLVEACLSELPIIAADCNTGPSEIVKEGVNGYLFEVGNTLDFFSKIEKWIKNRKNIKNHAYYAKDYSEQAGEHFLKNILRVVYDK